MNDILIVTEPGDTHAHATKWALERLGGRAHRWISEQLESAPATLRLSSQRTGLELTGVDGPIDAAQVKTVWLRRFGMPVIPDAIAPGDALVAKRECEAFLRGLLHTFDERVGWFNPPAAQRVAGLKARQLAAALRVGLTIPNTVMTNDLEAVRALMKATSGRVIYKGFRPAFWHVEEACKFWLRTVVMSEDDLSDAEALRLSPGIFQEFVEKALELRVTVFGKTVIAAAITNQHEIDWRNRYDMTLSPFELPAQIEARLLRLMEELGLVMGSIDLILSKSGEYVFLEVNEQGQFLWVEQMNPEIRLLEPFARFLLSGDPQFRWGPGRSEVSFVDYLASPEQQAFEATESNQVLANPLQVPEYVG